MSRTRKSRGVVGRAAKERRKALLKRQGGRCAECRTGPLKVEQVQADHIVPLADGGIDDVNNLQALCLPCHNSKTRMENAQRVERARRLRRDADPSLWQAGRAD